MIKHILHSLVKKFEDRYQYDCAYQHEILDTAGTAAFLKFAWVQGLSGHCSDLPREAWYAARVEAMLFEDCGPCTQLNIKMADEAGVAAEVVKAVVTRDDEALAPDTRLAVRFVRAVSERSIEAEELREEVRKRFGPKGLVTLAYVVTSSKLYPALKYSLGHGQECRRLQVGGETVQRYGVA